MEIDGDLGVEIAKKIDRNGSLSLAPDDGLYTRFHHACSVCGRGFNNGVWKVSSSGLVCTQAGPLGVDFPCLKVNIPSELSLGFLPRFRVAVDRGKHYREDRLFPCGV